MSVVESSLQQPWAARGRCTLLCVALAIMMASPRGLAAPQAPASSAPNTADADKKLASLTGVAVGFGAPVANATVTLATVYTPGGPIPVTRSNPPVTRTDAAGKFSFERIAPGSYMLRVTHPAYLPAVYGAPADSSGGTVLTLAEGRQMAGVTVKLVMPGVVTGRVVDEDGDPYPHGNVQVLKLVHFNGRPQVSQVAKADSGDDGKFKVEGVPPGRFYLRVGPQPTWTVADRAPVATVKPGQKDLRPNGTYLGGTTEWVGAMMIEVGPSQTIAVGDFKIRNDTWVHVRGKVIGDPALLQGARVIRMPREPTGLLPWSYGADIQKDGSYDLAHVWSGGFTLTVMNQRGQYFGWTPIVANHEDLEGVVIHATAAPLSGSVRLEGEDRAAPAAGTSPPRRGTVSLASAEGATVIRAAGMVKPDGSFTIPLLAPGKYVADVTGLPPGSYVKSLRVGGVDALNSTLDWGGSDNRTLEAVISAKAAVLEGVVQDDDGKPAPDSIVTLVPVPARFGHARLYPSVKADRQGHFRFPSLAPGAYKVYAWEEIDDTAHWDPDYIRPFEGQGERVELDEGGHGTSKPTRISAAAMQDALRKVGQ
jgi:protocatechuate 3,4-dioxygenase beta subunit